MAATESRWFPGQSGASQRFEYGWPLAADRWDVDESNSEVRLTCLRLAPVRKLLLDFLVEDRKPLRLEFPQISDVQMDGSFDLGTAAAGWEVLGTAMLVAERPREDGRLVYVLELPHAQLCLASLPVELRRFDYLAPRV